MLAEVPCNTPLRGLVRRRNDPSHAAFSDVLYCFASRCLSEGVSAPLIRTERGSIVSLALGPLDRTSGILVTGIATTRISVVI
jgi:hypothetical protein